METIEFTDGQTRTTFPDGKKVTEFADADTGAIKQTQTTFPDRKKVTEFLIILHGQSVGVSIPTAKALRELAVAQLETEGAFDGLLSGAGLHNKTGLIDERIRLFEEELRDCAGSFRETKSPDGSKTTEYRSGHKLHFAQSGTITHTWPDGATQHRSPGHPDYLSDYTRGVWSRETHYGREWITFSCSFEDSLAKVADAHRRAQEIQEREKKARKVPPLKPELHKQYRLAEADYQGDSKAVQKFKAAHSDYGGATDEDLLAARVYSREQPTKVYSLLNADCRKMTEHDEPPEHCCSTFTHLKRAVTEMRGSGADAWLYRGQDKLYGEDSTTFDDPEDPRQYETGRIVHWRAFTSTSANEDKARVFARNGVLFRIKPRDQVPNLGAILKPLSAFPGEEETLLPPGTAFQVLCCEVEASGTRVITLRHVGTWVSEKIFERNPELQRERAQEMRLVVQLTAMEACLARQWWARAHPEVDITSERSALAQRTGKDSATRWATALARKPMNAEEDSYVEFTRIHGSYPYVGVARADYASVEEGIPPEPEPEPESVDEDGFDPTKVDGVHSTEHGWMYTCDYGNHYHEGENVAWVSGQGQRIEEGETVGLRLRQGSLIAYRCGVEVGVLCEGLRGQFVWAADLKDSGTSVRITGKPPPR